MAPIQSIASIATTHEAVVEPRPEQRRDDRREEDDEPAHRRRAALALVARRAFGPDHLPDLLRAQPRDDRRPHHEREQQRRDRRAPPRES